MKKPKIEDLNLLSDELYLQAIKNLKLKKFMKDSQKPKEAEKGEPYRVCRRVFYLS